MEKGWLIEEEGFNPCLAGRYETLFTLTNGYMGVRGTLDCTNEFDRKGTFLAGVYDKGQAQVTELVNCPSFLNFSVNIEGQPVIFEKCSVTKLKRCLDMKHGTLNMNAVITDCSGRTLMIDSVKVVSAADKRTAFFSVDITPLNFSGGIEILSGIDATTANYDKSSRKEIKHYKVLECTKNILFQNRNTSVVLDAETIDNKIKMVFASVMDIREKDEGIEASYSTEVNDCGVIQEVSFQAQQGKTYTVDKIVTVFHSLEFPEDITTEAAARHLKSRFKEGVPQLLITHEEIMGKMWGISDIKIEGNEKDQTAVRFNIYNLMMLGCHIDRNSSIGAKGLHGEGYKGHIFWDTEIFVLPFFIYNYPSTAKSLLLYRYDRLAAAKGNAEKYGYTGARFPWESADTGDEVTPNYFYPEKGEPIKCLTGDKEIHITAGVAFAFYEYYRITKDTDFYLKYVSEVLLETAKYWVSRLEYNECADCYEITDVIGPDEYHINVNNNFYTNYMARWNIIKATEIWEDLKENYQEEFLVLSKKTGITEKDICAWKGKALRILLNSGSEGVFEQFDRFFALKDYVIDKYNEKGMPVLPSSFKGEKDFWGYQLIKQADVVMLLHLFSHEFSFEQKRKNYEYYEKRTIHWSSLSPSIYSLMGADVKITSKAYEYFKVSAYTDLEDNQGNTKDGLHAAAVGGTWQAIVFGFGGFRIKNDEIHINPWLPESWESLEYRVLWKGNFVNVFIDKKSIRISIDEGGQGGGQGTVLCPRVDMLNTTNLGGGQGTVLCPRVDMLNTTNLSTSLARDSTLPLV
jgi:kojibiose phosphorylase